MVGASPRGTTGICLPRCCLELGELRDERHLLRPDPLALRTLREASYGRHCLRAHLDRGVRVRHEVVVPDRVVRTAAVGAEPGIPGGMGRPAATSSSRLQRTCPAFARNSAMIRSFQLGVTGVLASRRAAIDAEDPWAALTGFYEQALTDYARHRAMTENFALTWSVPDLDGIRQLRLVIEELFARATDLLPPGVTTDDLLLLLVSLGHAVEVTDECRPRMWNRLLRISLDGLRADHREPLPADDGGAGGVGRAGSRARIGR